MTPIADGWRPGLCADCLVRVPAGAKRCQACNRANRRKYGLAEPALKETDE